MTRTLGVVIPAYRPDVEILRTLVETIERRLAPDALLVELDAPTPDVRAAVDALPATVNTSGHRRGKGAAITRGFESMDVDVLAFLDADGSVPVESLADVVAPVREGRADLAVGSRRHPAADVRTHQSVARRWLGDGFARLARFALDVPLYDYQCGAKAVDRSTWEAIRCHLYEPGFAWDVELVAMAGAVHARIVEVPVVWIDRPDSTVDVFDTVRSLGTALLVVRRRATRLRADGRESTARRSRSGGPALVDRHEDD